MRLKVKDIPDLRNKIAKEQDGKCCLCDINLSVVVPCLDHDHETGKVRGVLCGNCNGIEGKIHNLARRAKRDKSKFYFLDKILEYWGKHSANPRDEFHPTHLTDEEKRLKRNKKAREKRKKA